METEMVDPELNIDYSFPDSDPDDNNPNNDDEEFDSENEGEEVGSEEEVFDFATEEDLLAPDTDDPVEVILPIKKKKVLIRKLTREEAYKIHALKNQDRLVPALVERKIIFMGLVQPEMTEAQVRQWQKVGTTGDVEYVARRISEISGIGNRSDKSSLPEVRKGS